MQNWRFLSLIYLFKLQLVLNTFNFYILFKLFHQLILNVNVFILITQTKISSMIENKDFYLFMMENFISINYPIYFFNINFIIALSKLNYHMVELFLFLNFLISNVFLHVLFLTFLQSFYNCLIIISNLLINVN